MQVILLEKNEKLGNLGDVANVKSGYARNYLIPQGKAKPANKENLALFETIKAESFFPLKYLSGKEKFLALLGEKSLGTYILKPNRFKRFITKFQITSKYACRTIIYKYKTKHILVKEYFPVCMSMDSLTLLKCRRQV